MDAIITEFKDIILFVLILIIAYKVLALFIFWSIIKSAVRKGSRLAIEDILRNYHIKEKIYEETNIIDEEPINETTTIRYDLNTW